MGEGLKDLVGKHRVEGIKCIKGRGKRREKDDKLDHITLSKRKRDKEGGEVGGTW